MKLVKKDKNGNIETICEINQPAQIPQVDMTDPENPQVAMIDNPNLVNALADGYVRDDNVVMPMPPSAQPVAGNLKSDYAAASTTDAKLNVIAKALGLV